MRILIVGASGYVGSRVLPALLDRGHEVLAGVRDPASSESFVAAGARVVHCDVLDAQSVEQAVRVGDEAVDAVLYLVHRMSYGTDFPEEDAEGARTMSRAMAEAGVGRCVYLSGLRPDCAAHEMSAHMASRGEVEDILSIGTTPVLSVRAGVVLGAGSTSFEVLRSLCDLLPVQPIPPWMRHRVEPVAEIDVVESLCGAMEGSARRGHADIGCGERYTYPELLRLYARLAGRPILQVPVPPVPWDLVASGLAGVIPQDAPTVAAMLESLRHDMVCADRTVAADLVPNGWRWTGAREAIRAALDREVTAA